MLNINELTQGKIFYICHGYHYVQKCQFINRNENIIRYKLVAENSQMNGLINTADIALLANAFTTEEEALACQNEAINKVKKLPENELLRTLFGKLKEFELLTEKEVEIYEEAILNVEKGEMINPFERELERAKGESNFAILALGEAHKEINRLKNEMLSMGIEPVVKFDEAKVAALEKENADLLNAKKALEDEKAILAKENITLVDEKERIKTELSDAVASYEETKKFLDAANKAIEVSGNEIKKLREQMNLANRDLANARNEAKQHKEQNVRLKEFNDKLKQERKDVEALQGELSKTLFEKEELFKEYTLLKEELENRVEVKDDSKKEDATAELNEADVFNDFFKDENDEPSTLERKPDVAEEVGKEDVIETVEASSEADLLDEAEMFSEMLTSEPDDEKVVEQKEEVEAKVDEAKEEKEEPNEIKQPFNMKAIEVLLGKLEASVEAGRKNDAERYVSEFKAKIRPIKDNTIEKEDLIRIIGMLQDAYPDEMIVYGVYNGNMAITNLYFDADGNKITGEPKLYYGENLVAEFWARYEAFKGDMEDGEALCKMLDALKISY